MRDYSLDETSTDEEIQREIAKLGRRSGQKGGQSSSPSGSGKRGFAAMSLKTRREIASEGGKAAHRKGTAHEWNSEEASKAGRIGGSR